MPFNIEGGFNDIGPDTTAPVITLNGASVITLTVGDTYNELGATTDDGSAVVVTNPVNTATPATYTVRYNATDEAGNVAIEVTRTVIVEAATDTTKPILSANPTQNNYDVVQFGAFTPPVVTWSDNGNTGTVQPAGTVDTAVIGDYTLTYSYSDQAGNAADNLIITVSVFAASTNEDIQQAIAETDFEVLPTPYIVGFAGRSNVEIMKFKPLSHNKDITLDEDGYFDFENNDVRSVEVIGNGVTLSSAQSTVNFDGGNLEVEVGALAEVGYSGRFGITVVVYAGNDTNGVVIAGANMPKASPVLTLS